ncbi:YopX family protein [Bacillus wiedmannii]|uniref:YopX family protein n=1 Tax=Bacillus wiedmannii TaxID=1890302 RepID=UPI0024ADBFA1|nr:YopX family protein [Bacillus wiedmannii]MDI6680154.1 YopX family protein [Bacillus wiedmannii]
MKAVEFRAWDIKRKEMIMIDDLYFFEQEGIHEIADGIAKGHHAEYKIMQYTGIKDTEGKKIFEGDLVRIFVPNDPEAQEYISTVFELDGALVVKMAGYDIYQDDHCVGWVPEDHELEVIGNIYESKTQQNNPFNRKRG